MNFHSKRPFRRPLLFVLLACQLLLRVHLAYANTHESVTPISLKAALQKLEHSSPQLLLERALAQRAHADRRQLQAQLLPNLRLSGRQSRQLFLILLRLFQVIKIRATTFAVDLS